MNKHLSSLLCCSLLSCLSLFAQTPDEKQVADRVESLRRLLIDPDKSALEDLAAAELSYGHSTGLIEDKAGFVNSNVQKKTVFTSVNFSDQTIKIAGDLAIVRNHFTGETNNNQVPGKIDIIVLLIWQKQNGQWKLLARQAAKIPAP
jgi:hypothetical protein